MGKKGEWREDGRGGNLKWREVEDRSKKLWVGHP